MTRNWSWKAGLFTGLAVSALLWADWAAAQVRPIADETLGGESSVVTPGEINGLPGDLITEGARRGANLFHSFQEFSIDEGRAAYFANPDGVENILGRVTGGGRSEILGQLGVLGEADLFLLNPNGIVFGPNSSLDIRGSFIASTANSLLFEDGFQFSSTNPTAPPLLSINVPIGLQYGVNPGAIRVEGQGHNLRLDPRTFAAIRDDRPAGLQVGAGQTLALVGGEVILEGGNATAEGGRLELGSVAGGNLVMLTPINSGWMLDYVGVEQFQDIRLTQAASADSSGSGGGDIQVQGRNVFLSEGSAILADTLGDQSGGLLTVHASQLVEISGVTADGEFPSSLTASVAQGATGAGGDLTLITDRLRLANGGGVSASTFGAGDAGNLTIRAQSAEVIGVNPVFAQLVSGLTTAAEPGSTGDGGDLILVTDRLRLADGGQVIAAAFSSGNAGELKVQAQFVEIIGASPVDPQFPSALTTATQPGSTGNGGDLTILTDHLRLADGGQVFTSTLGVGNAGNLTVRAQAVEILGVNQVNGFATSLSTSAQRRSTGDGGDLTVVTDRLHLADGGGIFTSTFGAGHAGDLIIQAQSVEVIGVNPVVNGFVSVLTTAAGSGSTGDGGDLTIVTNRLRLADGGRVSTSTSGAGDAGDLTVQAQSVEILGANPFPSSLAARVNRGAGGNAGDLMIETERLQLANGGVIGTETRGNGNAGRISIQAASSVALADNSSITTAVEAEGAADQPGNIDIETRQLSLSDRSNITASTAGDGDGGSILIAAESLTLSDGSSITSSSQSLGRAAGNIEIITDEVIVLDNHAAISSDTRGGQGDIDLAAGLLLLRDNSTITTNASGLATGGNIDIEADFIVAAPNENNDIFANAVQGSGGRITLKAEGIFGLEFRTRAELQQLLGDDPDELTPRNLPSNDVTAFSQTNPDIDVGIVIFQTPDVDPSQGLVELPITPLAADRIVSTCPTGGSRTAASRQSEFTLTGRGGLPTNPLEPLSGDDVLAGWASLDDEPNNAAIAPPAPTTTPPLERAIVEATSWRRDAAGNVVLFAAAPTSQYPLANPARCQ